MGSKARSRKRRFPSAAAARVGPEDRCLSIAERSNFGYIYFDKGALPTRRS